MEFRGTPVELLTNIINYHNSQVESYKQFRAGKVTVTNSTNNLYLYLSAEKDTFDTIKEKLIDKLNGELQVRKVNGVRYLDLIGRIGEEKKTEIRIAKNLISMSCDIDPTEIVTRLTPLGARIESKEEGATDASEARLTIESVNSLPYIDDSNGIREFGIQGKSITWDDVTIASNLLSKGREWLANQKTAHVQYKISAVDLSLIGFDINSFEIGNTYPFINPIMGIDERLRVIGKSLDINSPQNASLTIGDKFKTLNQYQSDLKKSAENIVDIRTTVAQQTNKISSLTTSLGEVQKELQALKESIDDANLQGGIQSISKLGTALEKIEKEIQSLPTTEVILQIKSDVKENTSSVISIEKSLDVSNKTIETMNGSINALQVDLESLTGRVTALEKGKGGV
ncbi:lysin [Bacillus anthracis]|nr:lysin [Bacillus anthracis]